MSDALVKGGLYQDTGGRWVNAQGKPVDLDALPAAVQKLIGYKKPRSKKEKYQEATE